MLNCTLKTTKQTFAIIKLLLFERTKTEFFYVLKYFPNENLINIILLRSVFRFSYKIDRNIVAYL